MFFDVPDCPKFAMAQTLALIFARAGARKLVIKQANAAARGAI
jgi:hypothetical protein